MAINAPNSIPVSQTNGMKDHKVNLFQFEPAGDWTRAIHHDLNIKRRTCTTFIPTTSNSNDSKATGDVKCGCKRFRREHSWDVFEDRNAKWNKKEHTIAAYNNAFGRLPQNRAHYIRCDLETNPKILAQLLFDVWKVKEPQLIMCIIGGAKYFKLNERLEREFIKGIIQAALKADGWIVTSGLKTGVVQLVGEAIHDHKVTNPGSHITAIGCAKWGGTKNRESLILRRPGAPSNINLDASMNRPKPEREKGQQDLEPNHTHFLLLDDGTYYGYESGDYRTRFVLEASRYQNKDVPIVTIVVEGGPDTLTTISRDLHARIPVVLIDGSGRVPNLLAKFLARTEAMINRSTKEEDGIDWEQEIDNKEPSDIEKLTKKFHAYADEIRAGLNEIEKGDKKDESGALKRYNDFLYCLQPAVRSRIQVYSLDGDHDLDDTIFEAIIQVKGQKNSDGGKGNKSSKEQLLKLALAWDAIEVAKEHIIKDDLSDLDNVTKEKLFFEALKRDRPEFINAFVKLNFNVPEMFYQRQTNRPWGLMWEKLAEIYNEDYSINKERRLLKTCLGDAHINSPNELDEVLRKLIGDYMKSIYTHKADGCLGKLQVCCRCQKGRVADSRAHLYRDETDDSEVPDPEEAEKEVRELVYRDLFFWAILTNRIQMCKVIMSFMQSRTCAALIASKVMKSYQELARDNELKDILFARANEFEEYANQSLQCCYSYDEDIACQIAIRRIHLFGGVTCLQVAVAADNKRFVGQPCCDQLLNNIWYGKTEPLESSFRQWCGVLLSIFTFGLLAPALISFRKEEGTSDEFSFDEKKPSEMTVNQTQAEEDDEELRKKLLRSTTKTLLSYGINYPDNYPLQSNYCPKGVIKYFRRVKQFHEAPFIKYVYNAASYIFFLLLFSYYLLFAFQPPTDEIPSIDWTEILVIIIVSTMLAEDIRQFLCQENRSFLGKLHNYFITNMLSSVLRVGSHLLFYIGLILRFTYAADSDQLSAAKIVLAYDIEIWFIRSLVFLGVARKMGPKLVMIRKMIIDLSFFIYVILVAMIGYAVASRSMYTFDNDPDSDALTFDGRSIFRHLLYPVYYFMYGSFDNELAALDENPGASTALATQVLLAFYMLFVNILLVNLLIAMFSFTFQSVQEQTDLVWRYDRYSLIREYFERPPLFPPFIIFMHMIECLKLILRHLPNSKLSNMNTRRAKTFKMIGANRQIDKDWSEFESYATNLYARTVVASQPSSSVAHTSSITKQESSQADTMNMPLLPLNFDAKTFADEISSIKRTIGELRNSAEEMNRCMQWMMNAMERVKMSRDPKPRLKSAVTTDDIRSTVE